MKQTKYAKETKTITFQGKTITVTHLTPIFSMEERTKRKREIEHQLYDIFIKYNNNNRRVI